MILSAINSSCCIFLILQNQTTSYNKNLIIDVGEGTIKGLIAPNKDYYMYLGIPYAKVDESNYFGSAIPYIIDDIFEAYDDSVICPQINKETNSTMGAINCLHLNIFIPISENTSATLLPVMIWIYGDNFHYGSSSIYKFEPSYFIQHNVIVVTFNYRTGPYGFMCLDIPEVPGNQGLKDQYLAIKWVKDNIEAFGGNKDQITVFGQDAGGHSIDFHLLSTRETLFNNIIIQSGSAQALTVLYEPDKLAPLKIARYVGLETDHIKKAVSYLSTINTNLVVNAAMKLNIQFKPCVESLFDDVQPFIENPWIYSKVPKVKNISIIMGFNKYEMATLFNKGVKYFNNTSIIDNVLKQVFDTEKISHMKDIITHFYVGDERIGNDVKWNFIRFASDFVYIHPIHRTLKKYIENGAGHIYFYMFSYVGERNAVVTKSFDEIDSGSSLCCASHSDDLGYLFNMKNKPPLTFSDQIIMQRMTTMWTNFAKYGNPTPALSKLLPVQWVPVAKSTYYYLNIDTQLVLGKRPLQERMAFWDFFYDYINRFQNGYEYE